MEQLLELLNEIKPEVEWEKETKLIDGKILDSFEIVNLITAITDTFDIDISPRYLVPENFNSVEAMWNLICELED